MTADTFAGKYPDDLSDVDVEEPLAREEMKLFCEDPRKFAYHLEHKMRRMRKERRRQDHAAVEYFLRGPVPRKWMKVAARAGGSAFLVGYMLWEQRGIQKSSTVTLYSSVREDWGIYPRKIQRGLKALHSAGLIRVMAQGRHKTTVVEILEVPGAEESSLAAPRGKEGKIL